MILQDYFNIPGAVFIGSRVLNCFKDDSDYDICCTLEVAQNIIQEHHINLDKHPMEKYMNIVPLGNGWVIRKLPVDDYSNITVDLVIFEEQKHLDIMKIGIFEMQKIPTYLIEDKCYRIEFFERILIHLGFKKSNWIENENPLINIEPPKDLEINPQNLPEIDIDEDEIPF
jgi:hypothetical protein